MYSRMTSLVGLVILTLSCIGPASAEAFSLEGYFAGRTSAVGSFSAINGVKRDFTVDLRGKWNGQTLTLVEDFVYSDGERDRKTWRFHKIAPNQYRGTREDVVGDTLVTIAGNSARFTYLVDLDAAQKRNRVRFHDTMTLQGKGRLINNATITKFGFPVAKTHVEFSR
jgi:hypothetical protein